MELVALAKFMRLSLMKAAHAVVSGAAYRKSGSAPHFSPGLSGRCAARLAFSEFNRGRISREHQS